MIKLNGNNQLNHQVINGDCLRVLPELTASIELTFLDPPFNQQKDYASCSDDLPEKDYWGMMREVCRMVFEITTEGGAIYFMQREKNTERVLRVLRETGWTFQNLIIWKKMTSAVPGQMRYGKSFQIIGFATKGKRPRVFNRLRIDPLLLKNQKYERENGVFVTDVWDDIRELTSGYFAGDEAIRKENGERFHKQQSPVALLLRILLSSTQVGDCVLDPFAGIGTCAVVAKQLKRHSLNIELDGANVDCIKSRLSSIRVSDSIDRFLDSYGCTKNLSALRGEPPEQQIFEIAGTKPGGQKRFELNDSAF